MVPAGKSSYGGARGSTAPYIALVFCCLRVIETAVQLDHAIGAINRHHKGDTFMAGGAPCTGDPCPGASSQTATASSDGDACTCQCRPDLKVFRDDLRICTDDIHECALAPFASGPTSQKIPFVFLPLKGQIVYPSASISFTGVTAPICVVSSAQFLTANGWVDIRNGSYMEPPFRLFRDEGRTFLQWLGEVDLRLSMEGRLILVHLLCKDMGSSIQESQTQYIFTPCVAFRVAGTPSVREVSFAADAHASEDSGKGLSVSEYVAIGVCSVLLGLIYVASVFLYLHVRRRRKAGGSSGGGGSVKDKEMMNSYHASPQTRHLSMGEDGVVKKNPLLQAQRQHHLAAVSDNVCYQSDSGSCSSDCDNKSDGSPQEDGEGMLQHDSEVQVTSALVHSCLAFTFSHDELCYSNLMQEAGSFERIPEENVSIVETLEGREDRPETVRNINNGTFRRKLYFNPAYFDPELLLSPPPAALDFLTKIREVISIAKHKMTAKRFLPSLVGIPEEDFKPPSPPPPPPPPSQRQMGEEASYCGASSRRGSAGAVSLKRENSRHRGCAGCPGCDTPPRAVPVVVFKPCCTGTHSENKLNSIRKWLEDVPQMVTPEDTARSMNVEAAKATQANPVRKTPLKRRAPRVPVEATQGTDGGREILEESGKCEQQPNIPSATKSPCSRHDAPSTAPPSPVSTSPAIPPVNTEDKENCHRKDVKPGGTVVKKKLMDAVIKELVVAGQRGMEVEPVSPVLPRDIPKDRQYSGSFDRDSLERSEYLRREDSGFQTPSDYADIPPQSSPSLSSALPMDEEMVMRNAVFNKNTGSKTISKLKMSRPPVVQTTDDNDYEIIVMNPEAVQDEKNMKLYSLPELFNNNNGYSLVSEVYVNDGFGSTPSSPGNSSSSGGSRPKIRYVDEKKPGHLTIELEDSPENYVYNPDDSDAFEPDTLDRKSSKRSKNGYILNRNVYRQNTENFNDSLERHTRILLRTNGSFRSDSIRRSNSSDLGQNFLATPSPFGRTFGSLREIYEARAKANHRQEDDEVSANGSTRSIFSDTTDCNYKSSHRRARMTKHLTGNHNDHNHILHPDSRHIRRQRQPTPPGTVLKPPYKPPPLDVVPPRPPKPEQSIYEDPPPPRPIHSNPPLPPRSIRPPLPPKNGKGRSTSHKKTPSRSNLAQRPLPPLPYHDSRRDSVSSTSTTNRDFGTLSSTISGASADSLESSDYESFYAEPFSGDDDTSRSTTTSQHSDKRSPDQNVISTVQAMPMGHNRPPSRAQHHSPGQKQSTIVDSRHASVTKHMERHLCDNNGNESVKKTWRRVLERSITKTPHKPEDSGYLSTDSNESSGRHVKKISAPSKDTASSPGGHNSVSETDESLCDGASESGGESIATDSFFFGSCRKTSKVTESVDSGVGSELVPMFKQPVLHEEGEENTSDSENVSFVTVLSPNRQRRIRC